jgi:flagellar biogenesis protein FliO
MLNFWASSNRKSKIITVENTLLVVFSYNRTDEFITLLESLDKICSGFDVLLIDVGSTNSRTHSTINRFSHLFKEIIRQPSEKKSKTRGHLAENIQLSYDKATTIGYE